MHSPHGGIARGDYVLGAGDLIDLRLLAPQSRELGGRFEILDDGSARLALLGSVVLEGLTLAQASQWLRTLYGRHLEHPQLELHILRPRQAARSPAGSSTGPSPPSAPGRLQAPSTQRPPFSP